MDSKTGRRLIGIAVALGVSAALVATATPALARPSAAPAATRAHARIEIGKDAWQLFRATNASRGRFDVPKLLLDREMSAVARRHSAAMARAGGLFHTTDVDVYLHGIDWHIWGENVGYTPWDVASVQQAFMDSPPHRENILNRSFRHVAIGTVRVDGTLWVTVFFYV
jgi:uncharacterized protein YkwD